MMTVHILRSGYVPGVARCTISHLYHVLIVSIIFKVVQHGERIKVEKTIEVAIKGFKTIQKLSDDPFVQVYAAMLAQMVDPKDDTFTLDHEIIGPDSVVRI